MPVRRDEPFQNVRPSSIVAEAEVVSSYFHEILEPTAWNRHRDKTPGADSLTGRLQKMSTVIKIRFPRAVNLWHRHTLVLVKLVQEFGFKENIRVREVSSQICQGREQWRCWFWFLVGHTLKWFFVAFLESSFHSLLGRTLGASTQIASDVRYWRHFGHFKASMSHLAKSIKKSSGRGLRNTHTSVQISARTGTLSHVRWLCSTKVSPHTSPHPCPRKLARSSPSYVCECRRARALAGFFPTPSVALALSSGVVFSVFRLPGVAASARRWKCTFLGLTPSECVRGFGSYRVTVQRGFALPFAVWGKT